MRIKTRAIILHTTKYSETSLIVRAYTEESGACSFIVGGVRGGGKSRFAAGVFQPFSLVEIIASGKPGNDLHRITEVQFAPAFTNIPNDIVKSSMLLFLSEVVSRCIREEEPSPSLFQFMHHSAQVLDLMNGSCSRFHLHFLVRLTRYVGFYPNGEYSVGTPYFDLREGVFVSMKPHHADYLEDEVSMALFELMTTGFEDHDDIQIRPAVGRALLQAMVAYYELHLTHGREIHSHKILSEVLA
jgi:DNA repair protein RecO (recombination protein O)